MSKSKEHIKRFLSSVCPAEEKDEHMIKLFFNKRKIKVDISNSDPDCDNRDRVTYEQVEEWYHSTMPTVGDPIKCEATNQIGLVVKENWDSFVVGAILSSDGGLSFGEYRFSDEKWEVPSKDEILALQRALASHGCDWSPIANRIIERKVPSAPKYVRLMVLGTPVGIGVFKEILADGTLEMYCIKMGSSNIRYKDNLNLGDADGYSFFDTYDEHRAGIQAELGEMGVVWDTKHRRIEKSKARAKLGKGYFYVNAVFVVQQATETNSPTDRRRFNRGNYFLRKQVAERAKDKMINVCKDEMLAEDNF